MKEKTQNKYGVTVDWESKEKKRLLSFFNVSFLLPVLSICFAECKDGIAVMKWLSTSKTRLENPPLGNVKCIK